MSQKPPEATVCAALKYRMEFEDLIAYNLHVFYSSKGAKRAKILWWGMPVLVIAFRITQEDDRSLESLLLFSVPFLFVWLAFFSLWWYVIRKRLIACAVSRFIKEGKNTCLFGENTLQIVGDSIQETGANSAFTQTIASLEKIVLHREYVFIYLSAVSAVVINRKKVLEGDVEEFLLSLRERISSAGNELT